MAIKQEQKLYDHAYGFSMSGHPLGRVYRQIKAGDGFSQPYIDGREDGWKEYQLLKLLQRDIE